MGASTVSFSCLLSKPPPPPSRSHHLPFRIPSPPFTLSRRRFPRLISSAVQDNVGGGASETLDEEQEEEKQETKAKEEEGARVTEELKAMMAARKKSEEEGSKGGGDLIGGVLEEVREIEWPPFGKVVGTTGVVLSVIAGSSVALLTVNAVLAELSDRVFAGKGIQDFFG